MALPKATDVEYAGTSASGGYVVGQSATEKVGFYGTTPVVQPASASQATVAATTTTTATTTALQTDLDALRVLTLAMRTALVNTGIIKGSA